MTVGREVVRAGADGGAVVPHHDLVDLVDLVDLMVLAEGRVAGPRGGTVAAMDV